jgi:hypothetical protein
VFSSESRTRATTQTSDRTRPTAAGDIAVIFHPDAVVIGVHTEIDQIIVRRIGVVRAERLVLHVLEIGVREEIIVVGHRAELERMVLVRRDFSLQEAGKQILFGEGHLQKVV